MSLQRLEQFRETTRKQLDRTVDFWLKYSHDTQYGGFFTCLSRDGQVYDELKYVWLQGRQVWMYSRLYRTVPRFRREEILQAAKAGGDFLRKHARVSRSEGQWKCAFSLTRDGRALKVQRTIFSECFYVLALDELSRVTQDEDMQAEAEQVMDQLVHWVKVDPSGLGRPSLPGDTPTNSMAVPMMLLCLVQQLSEARGPQGEARGPQGEARGLEEARGPQGEARGPQGEALRYRSLGQWCVQQILQHVQVLSPSAPAALRL